MQLKTLHTGGITVGRETVCIVHKSKLHEVMHELNGQLFDYCYSNQLPIRQLPVLDDFTRSQEDPSYWSCAFPDLGMLVWLRTELIEF